MTDHLQAKPQPLPAGFVTQPYGQQSGTKQQDDDRLTKRDPAPNATQPLVPTSPTVVVKVSS